MLLWVAFRFNAPFPHRFLALNMPGSGFGSGICWCSGSFNIISLIQGEYYPTTPARTKYYPTGFIIPHTFICGSLSVGTRAGPTNAWCLRQVAASQHPESRFSRKLSRRLSSPNGLNPIEESKRTVLKLDPSNGYVGEHNPAPVFSLWIFWSCLRPLCSSFSPAPALSPACPKAAEDKQKRNMLVFQGSTHLSLWH